MEVTVQCWHSRQESSAGQGPGAVRGEGPVVALGAPWKAGGGRGSRVKGNEALSSLNSDMTQGTRSHSEVGVRTPRAQGGCVGREAGSTGAEVAQRSPCGRTLGSARLGPQGTKGAVGCGTGCRVSGQGGRRETW